ncbi:hypothetical protein AACH10_12780 [Ideonella sp. DXS22W]|uniref:Secreted protein n=1 Tax=Pseudaquabacterium inlustre TaxID=2984192 RepID=A0ABU9CGZ8_9BURK
MCKPLSLPGLLVATLVLLTGCGGGSTPEAAAPTTTVAADDTVPTSAISSVASFTDYVAMRPESEKIEPLKVSELVPPTSETDEPAPVKR